MSPSEEWVMFTPQMSIGPFPSESEARNINDIDLEWPDVEFITMSEFLKRQQAEPDLEIECYGGYVFAEVFGVQVQRGNEYELG